MHSGEAPEGGPICQCAAADAIPIAIRLLNNKQFQPGPFYLGKIGIVIGWIAVGWVCLITAVFVMPTIFPVTTRECPVRSSPSSMHLCQLARKCGTSEEPGSRASCQHSPQSADVHIHVPCNCELLQGGACSCHLLTAGDFMH